MVSFQSFLHFANGSRDIKQTDLREGEVPVFLRVAQWVDGYVALAMTHTSIVD